MDSSTPLRVGDDQGNRLDSPASVEGGQASHAPSVNEPEQVAGGYYRYPPTVGSGFAKSRATNCNSSATIIH